MHVSTRQTSGEYDEAELRDLLLRYLSQDLVTAQRIRDVLLPAALAHDHITREDLKQEFIMRNALNDPATVGYVLSLISGQIGMQKNDFLRQVIDYGYPNYPWEKDNYSIRPAYQPLIKEILAGLNGTASG